MFTLVLILIATSLALFVMDSHSNAAATMLVIGVLLSLASLYDLRYPVAKVRASHTPLKPTLDHVAPDLHDRLVQLENNLTVQFDSIEEDMDKVKERFDRIEQMLKEREVCNVGSN